MARPILILGCLLACAVGGQARERQYYGVAFEEWVRHTFFDGYEPASYTQKWDIPADKNLRHGHIPVNPKTAKYGGPVDLGDALRQFDIDKPFLLIIGYWKEKHNRKHLVQITAIRVEPATWRKLWGDITRDDLEKLDAVIKDRSLTPKEARRRAQKIKRRVPYSKSIIVLNPKIGSKNQRRLQCSLRFDDVFRYLAPQADPTLQAAPTLWGRSFPHSAPE